MPPPCRCPPFGFTSTHLAPPMDHVVAAVDAEAAAVAAGEVPAAASA